MSLKSQSRRPLSFYWFVLFALVFLIQVGPRLKMDSSVADEMVEITDGYYYWSGDVISDSAHPPLPKALQALPLRWMGLQSKGKGIFTDYQRRAFNFLFVLNRDRFESAYAAARFVSLLFGLGIGGLLFLTARKGRLSFLLPVMLLWSLEPNLLAFSGVVMADIVLAFFYLLAVYSFQKLLERRGESKGSFLTGILAGMAIASKFSGVLLIPVFLIMELLQGLKEEPQKIRQILLPMGLRWGWGLAGSFCFIGLLYLPGTLKLPDHLSPFDYFLDGFKTMAGFSGHPTYFMGQLSIKTHLSYFPTLFLIKSPLTFLFFGGLSVFLSLSGKIKIPAWHWIPALILFAAIAPVQNVGVREILPAYPFFILMAAAGVSWLWNQSSRGIKPIFKVLVGALFLFQAASLALAFPRHISYFNEMIPPERKIYWLGDSNLDMGQDTKRFALFARQKGWGKVKLAYFGTADPEFYGMKWDYWTQKDLEGPQPGQVYAVNAEFLQLGPAFLPGVRAITEGWISRIPPSGKLGDTWYYFEMPGEAVQDDSPRFFSTMPFKTYERLND